MTISYRMLFFVTLKDNTNVSKENYLSNLYWIKDAENFRKHEVCNMTELWLCIPFSNVFK